jgi:hypothetical protein
VTDTATFVSKKISRFLQSFWTQALRTVETSQWSVSKCL